MKAPRRLSLVWALVGVVAAVGIGLGAGALAVPSDKSKPQAAPSESSHPVGTLRIGAAPGSVGPYRRIAGRRGRRVERRIRKAMTGANTIGVGLYSDALIATYALAGSPGPDLLLVANDADSPTVLQLLRENDADTSIVQFLTGMGAAHVHEFGSAPLGGSVRCGTRPGDAETVCGWVDDSTFGFVIDYSADPQKRLAHLTRRLRAATEH